MPSGAVRAGDWKLIEFYEDKRIELYHLADDLGEQKDLAKARPEKTRELHGMLEAWRKGVGAAIPPPRGQRGKGKSR